MGTLKAAKNRIGWKEMGMEKKSGLSEGDHRFDPILVLSNLSGLLNFDPYNPVYHTQITKDRQNTSLVGP